MTLGGRQVPTRAALSLPPSAGQGRQNMMKSLWVEIQTGRDHPAVTVIGKTDLTWGIGEVSGIFSQKPPL